jgi:beta-lactam-binding protein with PASTA domain
MPGVFISYRREDSAGHAGRLFDRLRATFGNDRVFMDITGIEAGVDFVETIEQAVASCQVLVTVIGPEWLTCTDALGRPRLEDPADFTRIEIAAALKRNVRVVPVLIAGASMPPAEALPGDLRALARRQAVELRDTRWDADADFLLGVLKRVLGSGPAADAPSSPVDVALRKTAPGPVQPVPEAMPHRSRRSRKVLTGLAVGVLLAAAAVGFLRPELLELGRAKPTTQTPAQETSAAASAIAPPPAVTAVPPAVTAAVPSPQAAAGTLAPAARIPNVTGLSLDSAAKVLRDEGFIVGSRQPVSMPGSKSFQVTSQSPAAGTAVPAGTSVALVYVRPGRTLPALNDLGLDEAIAELNALGFRPGSITAEHSDRVPAKRVLRQSPGAGAELEPGAAVDLVYAEPVPAVSVPDVVGQEMKAALTALTNAGLAVSTREGVRAPGVPAMQIVRQDPPAGQRVEKGTRVALAYSIASVSKVPDVTNRLMRDVAPMLRSMRVTYRINYQDTDRAAAGTILAQSPEPGSPADARLAMSLTVARVPGSVVITILYHGDSARETAQSLLTFLQPDRLTDLRVAAVAQPPGLEGVVEYPSEDAERQARSLASRTGQWLSRRYGRSVSVTLLLQPRLRKGSFLIRVPRRD